MSSEYIYNILSSKPHNKHFLRRYVKMIENISSKGARDLTYSEKHHICPKAIDLFPEYRDLKINKWNLIHLTAREHFVLHWLLFKVYGGSQAKAFFAMCCFNKQRLNSKSYELAKLHNADIRKSERKQTYKDSGGNHHWVNTRDPRVLSGELTHFMTGRKMPEEVNKKRTESLRETYSNKDDKYWEIKGDRISKAKKGKPLTEEHKAALSKAQTGLRRSPEHIENARKAQIGLKRSKEYVERLKERVKDEITVMDHTGKCYRIQRNDPRVLSGELIGNRSKKKRYIDSKGILHLEYRNHPSVISGEFILYLP